MSCLRLSDVYAYLEGELTPGARDQLEKHVAACPRCRAAVEDRRLLGEAFTGLRSLEVPAGFPERVMAAIGPARRLLPAWLSILLSGSAAASVLLFFGLRSGQSLFSLLSGLDDSLWTYIKSAAVFAAKAVTLISAVGKALRPIGRAISDTFFELASAVSPAAQAGIVIIGCVFLAAFFYLIGRKFRPGERI